MANLDPVFCKMSVSIWIRGKTFFSQSFFTFLATKFSRFWGSWPVFRKSGSTGGLCRKSGSTEEWTKFLIQAGFWLTGLLDSRFQPVGTENLAFQIWGSALIEPQILQSKCSEQLCRILGSSQLEPRIRQSWPNGLRGQTKLRFSGVKNGQKVTFSNFSRSSNI